MSSTTERMLSFTDIVKGLSDEIYAAKADRAITRDAYPQPADTALLQAAANAFISVCEEGSPAAAAPESVANHEAYQQLSHQIWLFSPSADNGWSARVSEVISPLEQQAQAAVKLACNALFTVVDRDKGVTRLEFVADISPEDVTRVVNSSTAVTDGFVISIWGSRRDLAERFAFPFRYILEYASAGCGPPIHAPFSLVCAVGGVYFSATAIVPLLIHASNSADSPAASSAAAGTTTADQPTQPTSLATVTELHQKSEGENELRSAFGTEGVCALLRLSGYRAPNLAFPHGTSRRDSEFINTAASRNADSISIRAKDVVLRAGLDGRMYVVLADRFWYFPRWQRQQLTRSAVNETVLYQVRALASKIDKSRAINAFREFRMQTGVAARHLGLVYTEIATDHGRCACMTDICARVLYDIIIYFAVGSRKLSTLTALGTLSGQKLHSDSLLRVAAQAHPRFYLAHLDDVLAALKAIGTDSQRSTEFLHECVLPLAAKRFQLSAFQPDAEPVKATQFKAAMGVPVALARSLDVGQVWEGMIRKLAFAEALEDQQETDSDIGEESEDDGNSESRAKQRRCERTAKQFSVKPKSQNFGSLEVPPPLLPTEYTFLVESRSDVQEQSAVAGDHKKYRAATPLRAWLMEVLRDGCYVGLFMPPASKVDHSDSVFERVMKNRVDIWLVTHLLTLCIYYSRQPVASPLASTSPKRGHTTSSVVGIGVLGRDENSIVSFASVYYELTVAFAKQFAQDVSTAQTFASVILPRLMKMQRALDNVTPIVAMDLPLRFADVISTIRMQQTAKPSAIQQKENHNMILVANGKLAEAVRKQAELVKWVAQSLLLDEKTALDADASIARDCVVANFGVFFTMWMTHAHAAMYDKESAASKIAIARHAERLRSAIRGTLSRFRLGRYHRRLHLLQHHAILCRNLLHMISASVKLLQRSARGFGVRRNAGEHRSVRHHTDRLLLLATTIQRVGRGSKCRKVLYRVSLAHRVQRVGRGAFARQRMVLVRASDRISRVFAAFSVRKRTLYIEYHHACWHRRALFIRKMLEGYVDRLKCGSNRSRLIEIRRASRFLQRIGKGYLLRRHLNTSLYILSAVFRGFADRLRLFFTRCAKTIHEERLAFEKLLSGDGWPTYHALLQQNRELTEQIGELNFILDRELSYRKLKELAGPSSPKKPVPLTFVSSPARLFQKIHRNVLLLSPVHKGPHTWEAVSPGSKQPLRSSLQTEKKHSVSPGSGDCAIMSRSVSTFALASVLEKKANPTTRTRVVRTKGGRAAVLAGHDSPPNNEQQLGQTPPPQIEGATSAHESPATTSLDSTASQLKLLAARESIVNITTQDMRHQPEEPTVEEQMEMLEEKNVILRGKKEALLLRAKEILVDATTVNKLRTKIDALDVQLAKASAENDSLEVQYEHQVTQLKLSQDSEKNALEYKANHLKEMKEVKAQIKYFTEEARQSTMFLRVYERRLENFEKKLAMEDQNNLQPTDSIAIATTDIKKCDRRIQAMKLQLEILRKDERHRQYLLECKEIMSSSRGSGSNDTPIPTAPSKPELPPHKTANQQEHLPSTESPLSRRRFS